MKKTCLILFALPVALLASAQSVTEIEEVALDVKEDTTQVTTIADIVSMQESVASRNTSVAHYEKVWSYSSYFDLAYNNRSELNPKAPIQLGYNYNGGIAPNFKADWGASLVLGHNYGLHKPIAGIVKFNIDYTYIDLDFNHYKPEGNGKLYDSEAEYGGTEKYKYIPWCMEKYEANYGMALGASVTAAPFIMLNKPQLHFFKFNFFYHVGYHVSMLMAMNNKKYDVNPPADDKSNNSYNLNFGHGLTTSFGFRVSWKTIGFGYEMRTGKLDYVNLQKSDYGKDHYKFDTRTNRIFLEIRY